LLTKAGADRIHLILRCSNGRLVKSRNSTREATAASQHVLSQIAGLQMSAGLPVRELREHAAQPSGRMPTDRMGQIVQLDGSTNQVFIAAKSSLPQTITNDGNMRFLFTLIRSKQPSTNQVYTSSGRIRGNNLSDVFLGAPSTVRFSQVNERCHVSEDMVLFFQSVKLAN
jgi:hypothetical protein